MPSKQDFRWQSVRKPLVPIPNTIVKTDSGDNTRRMTSRKDNSLPDPNLEGLNQKWFSLFFPFFCSPLLKYLTSRHTVALAEVSIFNRIFPWFLVFYKISVDFSRPETYCHCECSVSEVCQSRFYSIPSKTLNCFTSFAMTYYCCRKSLILFNKKSKD